MIGEVFANALLRRRSEESLRAALAENERFDADSNRKISISASRSFSGIITGGSSAKATLLKDAFRGGARRPHRHAGAPAGRNGDRQRIAGADDPRTKRPQRPADGHCQLRFPAGHADRKRTLRTGGGGLHGAASAQVGRFVVADGSTLFLDEIGEFPLELQAKLLRVLQDGRFERLGSPKTITVNVRIIAATNRDLEQALRDGKFRADLYHRLNVFPIRVPPLRERREDIPALVWTFVETFGRRMGKTIKSIPRRTMEQLQQYSWPGNVRELSNVIERAMILTAGSSLRVEVPVAAQGDHGPPHDPSRNRAGADPSRSSGYELADSGAGGAAEILGIKPTTLEARMAKLGIRREKRNANVV